MIYLLLFLLNFSFSNSDLYQEDANPPYYLNIRNNTILITGLPTPENSKCKSKIDAKKVSRDKLNSISPLFVKSLNQILDSLFIRQESFYNYGKIPTVEGIDSYLIYTCNLPSQAIDNNLSPYVSFVFLINIKDSCLKSLAILSHSLEPLSTNDHTYTIKRNNLFNIFVADSYSCDITFGPPVSVPFYKRIINFFRSLFIKEKYTIDMSFCVDKDGFIKSIK